MIKICAIVLAAGKGTRMKSDLPKILHPILGKSMILYILETIKQLELDKIVTVIGNGAQQVENNLSKIDGLSFVIQSEQLGTGHAVKQTKDNFKNYDGDVLIVYGDTPLLKKETLNNVITSHEKTKSDVTILTCILENPYGYGRIIRDDKNKIIKIVEEKDASEKEKQVKEINTGIYCFKAKKLFTALQKLKPNNKQNELYLTDVIGMFASVKLKINSVISNSPVEIMGINNRSELAQATQYIRKSILEYWMQSGVTIIHPESTFIDKDVLIENDVTIYPFTIIEGNSIIKSNCKIGPNAYIKNSSLDRHVEVIYSTVMNSILHDEVRIGPFANIRPDTILEKKVKIGNFCEIKKSHVGEDSKISHLSYIGDSEISTNVNIGAGTITCNYDGKNKFKTIIKDNAFIGSNTNLVAPVIIGKNALVAAGSTITKNVEDDALGIAREKQFNIQKYKKLK